LCAVAEENADDVGLICSSGKVKGCLTPNGGNIRVGFVLDQIDDYVHATHEAGHVQGCQSRLKKESNFMDEMRENVLSRVNCMKVVWYCVKEPSQASLMKSKEDYVK
jgi:hypothetical protein